MGEYAPIAIAKRLKNAQLQNGLQLRIAPLGSSMKTKEQIDESIDEARELSSRIRSIDNLIGAIDNPELQDKYRKDILALVSRYEKMLLQLQADLAEFAKYERDNNLPLTLRYRRILKQLRAG
jgi:hypothetical protein